MATFHRARAVMATKKKGLSVFAQLCQAESAARHAARVKEETEKVCVVEKKKADFATCLAALFPLRGEGIVGDHEVTWSLKWEQGEECPLDPCSSVELPAAGAWAWGADKVRLCLVGNEKKKSNLEQLSTPVHSYSIVLHLPCKDSYSASHYSKWAKESSVLEDRAKMNPRNWFTEHLGSDRKMEKVSEAMPFLESILLEAGKLIREDFEPKKRKFLRDVEAVLANCDAKIEVVKVREAEIQAELAALLVKA
jgi:hypothetical protein